MPVAMLLSTIHIVFLVSLLVIFGVTGGDSSFEAICELVMMTLLQSFLPSGRYHSGQKFLIFPTQGYKLMVFPTRLLIITVQTTGHERSIKYAFVVSKYLGVCVNPPKRQIALQSAEINIYIIFPFSDLCSTPNNFHTVP